MILNQRRGNNMADFIEELDGMNELIYIACRGDIAGQLPLETAIAEPFLYVSGQYPAVSTEDRPG